MTLLRYTILALFLLLSTNAASQHLKDDLRKKQDTYMLGCTNETES